MKPKAVQAMEQLCESLKQAGQVPVVIGNKVLVLPFAGRVLGLYPDGETNLFWVHEALFSRESAQMFLSCEGWLNLGGDRTWISPEIETHIEDRLSYPAAIEVPKSVDPGAYRVIQADELSAALTSDMNVRFHQSKMTLKMNLTKKVAFMEKPPMPLKEGVSFAGYRMNYALTITEPVSGAARPGLWNLIQVPGGGEIIVPVKAGAKISPFIGKPVYSQVGNLVRCTVKTDSSYKFSLKADYSRGLMVYIGIQGDKGSLVVRKFPVSDPARYADYPSFDPSDEGYMTEIYVDDGQYGSFGELEYHSPALEIGKGETEVDDSSETWGFTGPAEAIRELCGTIIQTSLEKSD